MKKSFFIFFIILLISSCNQKNSKQNLDKKTETGSIIASYHDEKTVDLNSYPLLNEANMYLNSGEYEKMLEKLIQAEVKYGRMNHIYNEKGLCLSQLGRYDEALICYDLILEHDKNDFRAFANRAEVYYRLFKPDLAIADYNKAIEINPSISAIYFNKGLALLYKKDKEHACQNFNKALELGYAEDYSKEIYTVLKNECDE